jgi:hypothetical protein
MSQNLVGWEQIVKGIEQKILILPYAPCSMPHAAHEVSLFFP